MLVWPLKTDSASALTYPAQRKQGEGFRSALYFPPLDLSDVDGGAGGARTADGWQPGHGIDAQGKRVVIFVIFRCHAQLVGLGP